MKSSHLKNERNEVWNVSERSTRPKLSIFRIPAQA